MSDITLLAPLTATVQEDAEFETTGKLDAKSGGSMVFEVKGLVHDGAGTDRARVHVRAEITKIPAPGVEHAPVTMFTVATTLTVTMGDYVVLAAAPGENQENEALALIVRASDN